MVLRREPKAEPRLKWPERVYRQEVEKLIRAPELRGLPFSKCRQLVHEAAAAAARSASLRGTSIAAMTVLAGVYFLFLGWPDKGIGPQWRAQFLPWALAAFVVVELYRRFRLRATVRKRLQLALYTDGIIPAQCFRCRTSLEGFTGSRCPRCGTPLLREGAGGEGKGDGA